MKHIPKPLFTNRSPVRQTILLLVGCALLLLSPQVGAETITLDADQQFDYARQLFSNGRFEQAAAEWDRFVHFFPDDDRTSIALFHSGLCSYRLNRFQEAQTLFSGVMERKSTDENTFRAGMMIAECRIGLRDIAGATTQLQSLIDASGQTAFKDEALNRLGWLLIETAEWRKAQQVFQTLSPKGYEKFQATRILSTLETTDVIEKKNPTLSGTLSLLPGAGHLYCNRTQDAFIAFFLNTALAVSAWQAFDREMPVLGGLLTVTEIGVYSGTFYSAVSSAHKYNRQKNVEFIDQLKHRIFPSLQLGSAPDGFSLTLAIDF